MKIPFSIVRLVTGLSLTAGIFLGCQDFLGQKDDKAASAVSTDETALRLSIKDETACRERMGAIVEARKAGKADSAAVEAFLAACVKEVRADRDRPVPAIPPHLVPDSGMRCHWIGSQIRGGRDEMTVNFKRYCADDCRKLDSTDGVRHEMFCRDSTFRPHRDTLRPPRDTTVWPPRDSVWPARDSIKWPPRDTGFCDTLHVRPPITRDSACMDLKARLAATAPGSAERAALEKLAAESCGARVPHVFECEVLAAKLELMDPASAGYARLKAALAGHCPVVPVAP